MAATVDELDGPAVDDAAAGYDLNYKAPGPTIERFFRSDKFMRCVQGPFGSGKSVACCMEIMRRAYEQEPSPIDGIRYTRWAAIRNTHAELELTTIQGWLEWFPESVFGSFNWTSPYAHHFQIEDANGTIDIEILFLALDRPDDIKKLKSLNITGVWVNEASEVDKAIIDMAAARCRRFPSLRHGGPTWSGVIMDTNAPPSNHWLSYISQQVPCPEWMTQEERDEYKLPPNWEFFLQPPAMLEQRNKAGEIVAYTLNPRAENLQHLAAGYYEELVHGKDRNWIAVYILNRPGRPRTGKVVYPTYSPDDHSTDAPYQCVADRVVVGVDCSGLTPAAIFLQQRYGVWHAFYELIADNVSAERFGEMLRQAIFAKLPQGAIRLVQLWGDPAGNQRQAGDKQARSYIRIIRQTQGIVIVPAPFQDPTIRIDTVRHVLYRPVGRAKGLLVHRTQVPVLHEGFVQEYHFRRLQTSGEKYEASPEKNRAANVHDALQYALGGAGESQQLLVGLRKDSMKSGRAGRDHNPYDKLTAIAGRKDRRGWQNTRRSIG